MPDNTPYIVAAYAVTWVVLLGYAFHLWRVRAEAERRLENATHDESRGEH